MPSEGETASPWWWSSLDVRCGSRSLVVLFLHSIPGKMVFVPAGMDLDLGVKLSSLTAMRADMRPFFY